METRKRIDYSLHHRGSQTKLAQASLPKQEVKGKRKRKSKVKKDGKERAGIKSSLIRRFKQGLTRVGLARSSRWPGQIETPEQGLRLGRERRNKQKMGRKVGKERGERKGTHGH